MATFYDKMVTLCDDIGTSISLFAEKGLGLQRSTATSWKRGSRPNRVTLLKIMNFFGVSESYLADDTVDVEVGKGAVAMDKWERIGMPTLPAIVGEPPNIISRTEIALHNVTALLPEVINRLETCEHYNGNRDNDVKYLVSISETRDAHRSVRIQRHDLTRFIGIAIRVGIDYSDIFRIKKEVTDGSMSYNGNAADNTVDYTHNPLNLNINMIDAAHDVQQAIKRNFPYDVLETIFEELEPELAQIICSYKILSKSGKEFLKKQSVEIQSIPGCLESPSYIANFEKQDTARRSA